MGLPTMGRERRFPLLPATSTLELSTLRRTDLTASRDQGLLPDQRPHHHQETLTTFKTKILDSSSRLGNKLDHNNFLSNSSSNSNRRDSLSNSSSNSNRRDSLNNSFSNSNRRDSLNNNHRDSPHP